MTIKTLKPFSPHSSLCLVSLLSAIASGTAAARGQSLPARTGSPFYTSFRIPKANGTLQYSISATDRVTFGYNGANQTDNAATISGNLAFITPSVVHPFTLIYSGGYLADTNGQPSAFFQNLSLSQQLHTRKWTFTVSDSIHYLPETPSTGLSGIPGVGDLGIATGVDPVQGILTPYATRVGNDVSGDATRQITGKTAIDASGSYDIQRFLGGSGGLQTNSYTGQGSMTHRIDARTSITGAYTYSQFSYIDLNGSFTTQGATFTYRRQLTRRLEFNAGAGPERIGPSPLTGRGATYTYSADVHLTYAGDVVNGVNAGLSYTRSTNSGSGITVGAEADTVSGSVGRSLARSLQASAQVVYSHSSGLQLLIAAPLTTDAVIGSVQLNRAIGKTLSAYLSYSAQQQSFAGGYLGQIPLNGLSQIVGVGVTYSPTALHLGRQ